MKNINKFKESHLSQWMDGSKKPAKQRRQISEILGEVKKFIKQHPRLKKIGSGILVLIIIVGSIGIGISIGKKGPSPIKIPDELTGEARIIGQIEKDLSQQLQEIIDEEFKKTDYRYVVYLRLIETKTGERTGNLLEVYPVTANSWDNLFSRDREDVADKFIKIYKKYINKKSGEIHIRNNVQILAEASWSKEKRLEINIEKY